ncbi:MAG: hypothetical protein ACAI44_00560, partial [Candidatus Sericytochromatia bacterium]
MKRNLKTTLMLSTLFAAALTACGPQAPIPSQIKIPVRVQSTQTNESHQLLVRFRGQMTRSRAAEFNAKYGLHIGQFLPKLNVYIVDVDMQIGLKAEKVASFLQNDPMVEHVEVNYAVQVQPVNTDMQIMP